MANLVGKTLGKYKIVERLGRGGMAEVYKAYHPKLDRYVTVKILHSYLVEGEDFLARFEREAKAVASLRHAHIVQIHDYEVEDETYYMVVEFIDGGNLQAHMDDLSKAGAYMPVRQMLSIMAQVADALDYAHRQGIIHRDIKPSNILLDSHGNAFLSDFGIARILGSAQITTTGSLIGTPAYMSPEQGLGQELSDTSDIYSLGIVLYELLTGKAPFAADTPLAILQKQVSEPPLAPRVLRPDLPEDVNRIIARVLAKDAAARYETAVHLCHDLERSLPEEAIARLDAGAASGSVPLPVAPTIRMDEGEISSARPARESVAPASAQPMAAQAEAPPAAPKTPPTQAKKAAETIAETATAGISGVAAPTPAPPPAPSARPGLPLRTVVFGAIGIVVVGIAAILATNSSRAPAVPAAASPQPTMAVPTAVPSVRPSPQPIPTATAGIAYTQDFENGQPQGWELQSGWKVVLDGANHVLLGQGHYWAFSHKTYRRDTRLAFRLKLMSGRIHLVTHYNDVGRYYVGLTSMGSDLNKQIWPSTFYDNLAISSRRHNVNTWYRIEIISQGSTLSFLVDGKQELAYTDPEPLDFGYFAFETQSGAQAYVDDIVLELLPISASQ